MRLLSSAFSFPLAGFFKRRETPMSTLTRLHSTWLMDYSAAHYFANASVVIQSPVEQTVPERGSRPTTLATNINEASTKRERPSAEESIRVADNGWVQGGMDENDAGRYDYTVIHGALIFFVLYFLFFLCAVTNRVKSNETRERETLIDMTSYVNPWTRKRQT